MTDQDDGFLGRWARLKREARRTETVPKPEEGMAPAPGTTPSPGVAVPEEEPFDVSTLPPLESLGPGSDFKPFLQNGVPLALRNAALRKAWVSDPMIRDFREVADYDWDFNAPGYGKLLPTDDVRKLVERMFSRPEEAAPEAESARPARVVENVSADIRSDEEAETETLPSAPDGNVQPASPRPLAATDADHLRLPGQAPAMPVPAPAMAVDATERRDTEQSNESSQDEATHSARRRRHGGAIPS